MDGSARSTEWGAPDVQPAPAPGEEEARLAWEAKDAQQDQEAGSSRHGQRSVGFGLCVPIHMQP